jgi:hypothetical protein
MKNQNNKIEIPKPCNEDFSKMKVCNEGLYCGVCQKHVIDLRKKQVNEAQEILKVKNKEICVLINERFSQKSSKYQQFVNKTEAFLLRIKLKKVSLAAATLLLFIGGCRTRHMGGRFTKMNPVTENQETSIYSATPELKSK